MSGGSWEYLCFKIQDAADQLVHSKDPLRKAFGKHMSLVADAMHDIEWVDSGDKGHGDEIEAIRAVLEPNVSEKVLPILIEDANALIEQLQEFTNDGAS